MNLFFAVLIWVKLTGSTSFQVFTDSLSLGNVVSIVSLWVGLALVQRVVVKTLAILTEGLFKSLKKQLSWPRPRCVILALALLLASVAPVAATPIMFYGDTAFGSDWPITGSAVVFPYAYEPGTLLALVGIVPYTREIGAFPFTATWTLDTGPPVVQRVMMPEFDYGPLGDCRYGCPVIFGAIARYDLHDQIMDWEAHKLTLELSVPGETRQYAFDVLQPTPEPMTLILLGTSLAAAGWVAKRRRKP